MNKNKTAAALAGLGLALTLSLTAGAGAAQASTPDSAACAAAKQQVVLAQSSVDEATPTRNQYATQVANQKASRQNAINAGNVALVGQINVQLGSSTALYNTMDSSVASAQARLVQAKAAKNAAC
jgi:hypothetical protein